jgi:uncharacterized membrane protein YhaH (DUF805 family)
VLFFANNDVSVEDIMEDRTSMIYYIIVLISFFLPNIGIMVRRKFKDSRGIYNNTVSVLNILVIIALIYMMNHIQWSI